MISFSFLITSSMVISAQRQTWRSCSPWRPWSNPHLHPHWRHCPPPLPPSSVSASASQALAFHPSRPSSPSSWPPSQDLQLFSRTSLWCKSLRHQALHRYRCPSRYQNRPNHRCQSQIHRPCLLWASSPFPSPHSCLAACRRHCRHRHLSPHPPPRSHPPLPGQTWRHHQPRSPSCTCATSASGCQVISRSPCSSPSSPRCPPKSR